MADDDDDEPDGGGGPVAALTGTVWAPNLAPGMVGLGEEIPVAGAVVSLRAERPPPIPDGVYCEPCADATGAAVTDADGHFQVGVLTPGTYWLVIQKGQFRSERQVELVAGTRALTDAETVLPSRRDLAAGQTIPRIAVAVGNNDSIQDILGKLGLGTVGDDGALTSTDGELDFYTNGGADLGLAMGTLRQLVGDPARLAGYHIVFIPCALNANVAALADQATLRNLRDYVAAGGKLYVTDWSGEWVDAVFPRQLELGASRLGTRTDTPPAAYDPVNDTWDPALFGDADGDVYTAPDGAAVDPELIAWLDGQVGPRGETGGDVGPIDPRRFRVFDNWNWIAGTTAVPVGFDDQGQPVIDTPKVWVTGSRSATPDPRPLTVTYHPAGCGRVLYSTYHTAPGSHRGLLPQERVLLYLVLELGVCANTIPIGRAPVTAAPARASAGVSAAPTGW
jgi:hypothetical protein